jgi:hypothetical protein
MSVLGIVEKPAYSIVELLVRRSFGRMQLVHPLVHPQLACSLAAPRGVDIDGRRLAGNVRNVSVREEFARSSARRPRAGAPAGKGNGSRFCLDPVRIQLTCCSSPQEDHLSQKAA